MKDYLATQVHGAQNEANWAQAVADVRPFLEPNVDVSLLAPESLTRVLTGHEG